ncbi:MAG: GntR family transcriptional regulator [bacterium]|nr:GntR family transcriptional regulator [bacterium]
MNGLGIDQETTDKYSLRGRVFHRIREDILSGKYKINEELKEKAIATELGVSRTPVREALRQLELEGLVKIVPNKSAVVTGLSLKDMKDIYIIRSYLEGLCARLACENITDSQIEALEEIQYLFDFHAKKKHYDQLVELDDRFHDVIYAASNSRMLNHVLVDFHHYVARLRKETLSSDERAICCSVEHNAILEAIRKRDGDKAEELGHQHILNTIHNITKKGIESLL